MALNWPWEISGRIGSLCAAYVLENTGTQNHRYTLQDFVARYRSVFDDKGVLDTLITKQLVR